MPEYGPSKYSAPYWDIKEQPTLARWTKLVGYDGWMGNGPNSLKQSWGKMGKVGAGCFVGFLALKVSSDFMLSRFNPEPLRTMTPEWKAAEKELAYKRRDVDFYAPIRNHSLDKEVDAMQLNPEVIKPFGQGSREV